jgi:hypothetical protein
MRHKNVGVPAILLNSSDPIGGDTFADVTEENIVAFADAVQDTLREPLESALPMQIGPHFFARYVKSARVGGQQIEVQVLHTVRGGRMFTVELRVAPDEIKKDRDYAYAVAAGLKFGADVKPFQFNVPAETKPADAPPAEAKPAETKPAETKPAATK